VTVTYRFSVPDVSIATHTPGRSPGYFHTNPDGSIMGRAEVLASYRAQPTMTFSAADTSELVVVSRDPFAVVSERVGLHGKTREGDPFIST